MDKQDSRPRHQVIYVQLLGAELSWMAGKDGKKQLWINTSKFESFPNPVIR